MIIEIRLTTGERRALHAWVVERFGELEPDAELHDEMHPGLLDALQKLIDVLADWNN